MCYTTALHTRGRVWERSYVCRCLIFLLDLRSLRLLGLCYFLYLFLFSGLEYSLTFLTHQRFNYTRSALPPPSLMLLPLPFPILPSVLPLVFLPLFNFASLSLSLSNSMDQGKMFLFIGIIMILVQGMNHIQCRPSASSQCIYLARYDVTISSVYTCMCV